MRIWPKSFRLSRRTWVSISLVVMLLAFCIIPGTGIEGSRFSGNANAAAPEIPPALVPVVLGVVGRIGIGIRRSAMYARRRVAKQP